MRNRRGGSWWKAARDHRAVRRAGQPLIMPELEALDPVPAPDAPPDWPTFDVACRLCGKAGSRLDPDRAAQWVAAHMRRQHPEWS